MIKSLFKNVKLEKFGLLASLLFPSVAFAAQDGNDVITRIVTFLGSVTWLLLACMIVFGVYCMLVFGRGLQKMGDEDNPQEKTKPKTLALSLLGAVVCTYGTYTLGVAMRTIYADDATTNQTFQMPTRNTTGGGSAPTN